MIPYLARLPLPRVGVEADIFHHLPPNLEAQVVVVTGQTVNLLLRVLLEMETPQPHPPMVEMAHLRLRAKVTMGALVRLQVVLQEAVEEGHRLLVVRQAAQPQAMVGTERHLRLAVRL